VGVEISISIALIESDSASDIGVAGDNIGEITLAKCDKGQLIAPRLVPCAFSLA
jgi:hypothetical protein